MRTVHAYAYAQAVAKYTDRSTGLKLCAALVKEREAELDRDVQLEVRHDVFFRVLTEALGPECVKKLTESVNVRKESTIAGLIIGACDSTLMPAPDTRHWESCIYHRELLRRVFAVYLDCLTGKALQEITSRVRDSAKSLAEKLAQAFSAEEEKLYTRWGKVLFRTENQRLLLRAMADLTENEQADAFEKIFIEVSDAEGVPEPDEFALIVRRVTTPSDGKGMN